MNERNIKFSNNLKNLRRQKHLSQRELADQLETKRGNIGAYEEGRAVPSVFDTIKIARFFSVPLEDLVLNDIKVRSEIQIDKVEAQA
jgi:transcriptional regulator with XRE-family HTH domain